MSTQMQSIIEQYKLHTKLFKNATVGISDADAQKLTGQANHPAWLTGHIVSGRYMMASLLGMKEQEPYPDLFTNGKGRQPDTKYPSMKDLTKDWGSISEKVLNRLNEMADADWNAQAPFSAPINDGTLKGFFSFLLHHEAYTIGQISYIRRVFGLDAMKYS